MDEQRRLRTAAHRDIDPPMSLAVPMQHDSDSLMDSDTLARNGLQLPIQL